ncbi:MAG: hypothetical protein JNL32_07455 [Candidatus Kapabacteria bacterium]|nr:hypothetical protein [Candidatus Kapabacteria bacterium]
MKILIIVIVLLLSSCGKQRDEAAAAKPTKITLDSLLNASTSAYKGMKVGQFLELLSFSYSRYDWEEEPGSYLSGCTLIINDTVRVLILAKTTKQSVYNEHRNWDFEKFKQETILHTDVLIHDVNSRNRKMLKRYGIKWKGG